MNQKEMAAFSRRADEGRSRIGKCPTMPYRIAVEGMVIFSEIEWEFSLAVVEDAKAAKRIKRRDEALSNVQLLAQAANRGRVSPP